MSKGNLAILAASWHIEGHRCCLNGRKSCGRTREELEVHALPRRGSASGETRQILLAGTHAALQPLFQLCWREPRSAGTASQRTQPERVLGARGPRPCRRVRTLQCEGQRGVGWARKERAWPRRGPEALGKTLRPARPRAHASRIGALGQQPLRERPGQHSAEAPALQVPQVFGVGAGIVVLKEPRAENPEEGVEGSGTPDIEAHLGCLSSPLQSVAAGWRRPMLVGVLGWPLGGGGGGYDRSGPRWVSFPVCTGR